MAVSKRHLKRRHIEAKITKWRLHKEKTNFEFEGTADRPYKGAFGGLLQQHSAKDEKFKEIVDKLNEAKSTFKDIKEPNKPKGFFAALSANIKKFSPWKKTIHK